MSARVTAACAGVKLPPSQKLVLMCLADQANDRGQNFMPTIEVLSRWCGLAPRQIQYALLRLEYLGHLTQAHPVGSVVRYTLHPRTPLRPVLPIDAPDAAGFDLSGGA